MSVLRDALAVARLEIGLLARFPRFRLSLLGIVLIPALYALIYLESVWDPASRTGALPAVIVNLDQGARFHGTQVHLGEELTRSLQQRRTFGFTLGNDEAQARRDVRAGRTLFALIIPPDFSAEALAGERPGGGKLVVYASEGNNYTGAGFARRFADELGHRVNEAINERRWTLVLGEAAGTGDRLQQFRAGLAQLRLGAQAQSQGLAQAAEAADRLATGAGQVSEGTTQFTEGARRAAAGVRQLTERAGTLDSQARGVLLGPGSAAGAQLPEETGQTAVAPLPGGATGPARAAGADTLRGLMPLTEGLSALAAGLASLSAALPADEQLEPLTTGARQQADAARQFAAGAAELKAGALRLDAGLALLAGSLPAQVESIGGTARGLAAPVEPQVQIDAPVSNEGTGFAPNFLPLALWLGAVMTGFIVNLRRLPRELESTHRPALLLGKACLPVLIVLAQALAVLLMARFALNIQAAHPVGLVLTLAAASVCFMMITLALVRAFGDAGMALASMLLIVQLSSAGGIVPIELTSEFFRHLNPWLPFTWVVRAVRASMFGAFDSEWLSALALVVLAALVAGMLATWVGRWRFVPASDYRPALDL
ncbi:MAG: YhgE/Pip domain-containing protein [Betaproteobacteria bacterium]|nr:YhgE/Pip domain-containing protein [Betaproteobacteria bacterium]